MPQIKIEINQSNKIAKSSESADSKNKQTLNSQFQPLTDADLEMISGGEGVYCTYKTGGNVG